MSSKKDNIYIIFIAGLLALSSAKAQYSIPTAGQHNYTDTVRVNNINEDDLNRISDIRTLVRRMNASYSRPAVLNKRLQELIERNEQPKESYLSEKALRIINDRRDPARELSYRATFRDTAIMNQIFLPIIFRGKASEKLDFKDKKLVTRYRFKPFYKSDGSPIFEKQIRDRYLEEAVLKYVEDNYPSLIRYSIKDLPNNKIVLIPINTPAYEEVPIPIIASAKIEDTEAPPKFIPDRLYWTSSFESAIQFSQNYISPNWYKGGSSNLNIFTRNHLRYDYNRDKYQFANEIEIKANIYNAPNDTLHNYKIGDDILKLHSTLGVKAFPKWFYTLDAEFKTQLFTNYQENKEIKQSALFSPFSFNIGVGMKYDMEKAFKERGKKLKLNANVAPLSLTYMRSLSDDIDLGRHGFKKDPETDEFNNRLTRFGSTVRLDMTMSFNRQVTWQSRVYYFTNYEFSQFEFENTLTLAISRYFSTIIYAHIRFDDSVTKKPDYNSFFQLNERLSVGFNYKW